MWLEHINSSLMIKLPLRDVTDEVKSTWAQVLNEAWSKLYCRAVMMEKMKLPESYCGLKLISL